MGKIEKGIESNMVYLQIKELMENVRKQVIIFLCRLIGKLGKLLQKMNRKIMSERNMGKNF